MNMNKFITIRTIALVLSFFAYANLLIPDVLRAEIIKSQLQTGQDIEMIREKLCSSRILNEIRRFGLSEDEALQIRNVIADRDVLKALANFGEETDSSGKRIIRADEKRLGQVTDILEQSAAKHTDEKLRKKLSKRGKKLAEINKENLIASELSTDKTGKAAQIRISEIQKTITGETLVAMGMDETDAGDVVSRLNNQDLENIIQHNVKIEYGSGPFSTEMLLVAILAWIVLITAIILAITGEPIGLYVILALVAIYGVISWI
ncbi:MAG: hypothetical protein GY795_18835 [Desulfobacterales bacterium]|nr:hypothetical protein [Desulfobacterales bacterium]